MEPDATGGARQWSGLSSVVRKATLVKKVERSFKDKLFSISSDEDGEKEGAGAQDKGASQAADDYPLTGNLEQDYMDLCTHFGISEIPPIVPRIRPLLTPVLEKSALEETEGLSEDTRANLNQIHEKFSYFKPRIQVDLENEDPKAVREIFIQGWKIDTKMLDVFSKLLPASVTLNALHLWNVGLTDETLTMLATILPRCQNIKHLVLDGNPLSQQSYCRLFSEESTLAHVILRNNKINDEGAWFITQALHDLHLPNKHLVSLNLSYNHISDLGASYFAEVLRMNRSLLCLSLAHNQIGDEGALYLAEVLGQFALTTKEVVERRYLLLSKESLEQQRSPPPSRNTEKMEHPPAVQVSIAPEKAEKAEKPGSKSIKSASKKKEKEQGKKDEKGAAVNQPGAASGPGGSLKKEDPKGVKKQAVSSDPKAGRGKGPKSATKEKLPVPLEPEITETTELMHPLLEPVEYRDGHVFLLGNRTLINLNLSMNKITERGLKGFLTAIESQIQALKSIRGTQNYTGLLRLSLGKNSFSPDNPIFMKIQEIMLAKDPINKPKPGEEEQAAA
ncbi:leucine-rich repeat-containing protein 71 isoform X3 [Rhinatrema bivittatum]|uniref:leucine-rich repeat-containing protein 71 isoform X3 n=1 Tax=Rhinatrema bivittatum TaxID=194408 RepID=UPI00112ACE34|nr:leucine-rich repeat-containing protein 71 isoform X3 [Rhinatrema bivittatum]